MRAEINVINKGYSGAVLYDLTKCYEYVRHTQLATEGVKHNFPMHALRITIQSYRWNWRITHNGLLHEGVQATKGIIAGCAAATTELKLYMFTGLTKNVQRNPKANLEVYIDDITVEAHEKNMHDLVTVLGEAANDITETMHDDMHLQVSRTKTAVVTSDPDASKRIERYINMKGAAGEQVRNLGIDYTAGKILKESCKGKLSERRKRLNSAKKRIPRVAQKLGKKNRTIMIWTTGILPGLTFGAECTGYNPSTLKWMRGKASTLIPGGGKGAHQDTIFSIHPDRDPARANIPPCIVRYAKEVWLATDEALCGHKVIKCRQLLPGMTDVMRNQRRKTQSALSCCDKDRKSVAA